MNWSSAVRKQTKLAAAAAAKVIPRVEVETENVDWERLVTLDFETYYDSDYTLSKLSTSEYVRDPRFKAQMVGIKVGRKKTKVVLHKNIAAELKKINWATHSVLCHNVQFDGFILSHRYGVVPARYYDTLGMARGLHSNEIGAGLDEVAKFYGGEGKIDGALEKTKGVLDWSKTMIAETSAYCANDVDETFRIFCEMHAKYPAKEMDLIHMTARMFCAPVLQVDIPRVQAEYEREVQRREELLLTLLDPRDYDDVLTGQDKKLEGKERDVRITKKVVGSNERFVQLFTDMGIAREALPRKISPAWMKKSAPEREEAIDSKWSFAFAKDDLEFLAMPEQVWSYFPDLDPNHDGHVLVAAAHSAKLQQLIDTRIAVKSTTNITRAERFLKAGADGMRLPVGYAYYRAHCVPGNTEVLTPGGWVRLDAWGGGEIAQVNPDQSIEFLPATKFEGPVESEWLQVRAPYLKCDFTLGHTMPYFTQKGRLWTTEKAGNLAERNSFDVPIGGHLLGGGAITPEQMRVLVMVQADGSFETDPSIGRRMCVFVKKPRKIKRARQLLTEAGVLFKEQSYPSHPGMVRFIVRHADYPAWLTPERKYFGPWLLDSTEESREAFLDELRHWDGYTNHAACLCYSSSDEVNAEWAVTLAHLCGRSASTYRAQTKGRRRANYTVSFRERAFAKVRKDDKRLVHEPMKTFCASTQTGFWLARADGRIFVTGNTGRFGGNNKMNMQNLTRGGELRLSILAAKGHAIAVADSGQIEARVNGWLWGQDDLLDAFRHKRDVYSEFATAVYGRTITKADKTERHVGKVCVLGLGYQMGASKLQLTLAKGALGGPPIAMSLDQCQHIVSTYRRTYYKIQQGWKMCSEIIEQMAAGIDGEYKCLSWGDDNGVGYINLPNGMRLKYPDLRKAVGEKGWDEWSYQSGAIRKKIYGGLLCENLVQALARIIVMDQMLMIDKKYPVVMTTHDEVVAHPKLRAAQQCYDYMHQCMVTAPWWCPDIPLAAEGGWAANYSK